MKIAVITYDNPHQKTQDLICKLRLNGIYYVDLIVLPWVERKRHDPLYSHRPDNPVNITTEQLCKNFNLAHYRLSIDELSIQFAAIRYDKILIAGAGILPADVVKYNIINSHPGYLPYIRGLDALKWAILFGEPIGVTTYFIGEKPDTGILIDRKFVPVYSTDSFDSIARRQYDMEIDMMIEALTAEPQDLMLIERLGHELNKRMSHIDELRMMVRCKKLIENS